METHANRTGFESQSRLLAKLIRGLLSRETFQTLADVTEALKVECGRLRIAWTNDDISEAYRLIESNRPLVTSPVTEPQHTSDVCVRHMGLSHEEAAALLERHGLRQVVATMPPVRPLTDEAMLDRYYRGEQRRAYLLVQQLILETAHRVAELEDLVEADHGCTSTETQEGSRMTDPTVLAIGPHQLNWIDDTHATVRLHPKKTDVISVQPDGRIETRKEGTQGPYEVCLVDADRLVFAPEGVEGNVIVLPFARALP